ncbi:MAG: Imm10 family immunity protein [Lentisphaeraceae bacterium]|nr:Imm10 family immunity protein [Lentisphaeraceae bacterium]
MDCNSLSITGMEDSFAVCFGKMEADELSEYVMLQADLTNSNELYLEVNDQSSSVYGGILKCDLHKDKVTFDLNEAAALELDLEDFPAQLSIKLSLESDEIEELSCALAEVVFENSDSFESHL